jgi:hypothetical protein
MTARRPTSQKAKEVLTLRQRLDHAAAGFERALQTNAHAHHVRFFQIARRLDSIIALGPWIKTGQKVRAAAKLGGRRKSVAVTKRDIALAQEFLSRRLNSEISPTALKTEIGKQHNLKRSAAIDAIDRGLKIVSGKRCSPDK